MTPMTLNSAARDFAIDIFFHDHFALARWLAARYPDHEVLLKHAVVALAFGADCDWSWRKLASYALNEFKWLEAERELKPFEIQLRSIAERIYDTEVSVGRRLGIDLFPEDTLRAERGAAEGRAEARRRLDAACERAVAEIKRITDEGDPK